MSLAALDRVEERFKKRLGLWKCQNISKGGRTTLIGSMFSGLPIYYMSLFQSPKTIISKLDLLQRNFLWGGAKLDKKPHIV